MEGTTVTMGVLRDSYLTRATYNITGIIGIIHFALLPRELLANARVFDVGCNEGYMSCQAGDSRIFAYLSPLTTR